VPLRGDDGALVDPTGGAGDLERRVLRVLGGDSVAESAYASDPLRPLRLARLATELGFAPDERTERLTLEAAPRVGDAAPERVFAELRRLVIADRVLDGLELADRLGLVASVLPELAALHGVEQSHFHHLDVYGHTIEVLRQLLEIERDPAAVFGADLAPRVEAVLDQPLADELTRRQALRFAALLHDIGKPGTRGVLPNGRVTFIGHDALGEQVIGGICRRLRTSERLRSYLAAITRHHLVLGFLVHERPLSRAAVYRYLTVCEPVEIEVTVLSCADRLATRGRNADVAIALHVELARELLAEALAWRQQGPPRPPVRGDELAAALGVAPGPEIGELLRRIEEASFTGEVETRDDALALARRLRENAES
jgi:tRNA nucleotidyltransferase/poly(A) polymerase